MTKLMPTLQLAPHAKSSTLYGRSYGRNSKVFQLDGLLLFPISMRMWGWFAHWIITATAQILLEQLDFFEAVLTKNLFMAFKFEPRRVSWKSVR